jgi:hypothetical protein
VISGHGALRAVPAEPTHRPSHNFSWLYRATGGHITTQLWTVASAPLTTIGAKSGQPREVQLSYFHDGSDPILIASNYARPKPLGALNRQTACAGIMSEMGALDPKFTVSVR